MRPDAYTQELQSTIERLLTNMDRNQDADTHGCLCRPYWHDKAMDFPSTHQQIGVLPLAQVYSHDLEGNSFHGDERIADHCRAGIRYWSRIQRRDGSFDEHYPREHSLGATAWSLWAVASAIRLLDDPPDVTGAIRDAVAFIAQHDEPGTIANHQAVTADALFQASRIVDVRDDLIRDRVETVSALQHEDGWFQEYRGPDPGYQSTALAHLARIHDERPGLVDDGMLEDAVDFFASFIDADGYYGAHIGSRNTQHVHPTGFELLADRSEQAAAVAACLRKHARDGRILRPSAVDDKHFSWHHAELLASRIHGTGDPEPDLELEGRRYDDILIERQDGAVQAINLSRGGHLKRYEDGDVVRHRPGPATAIDGQAFTADWMGTTETTEVGEDEITVSGRLRQAPASHLTWWTLLGSRLWQHTIGRSARLALWTKDRLIERLITGDSTSQHRFRRTINRQEGTVTDELPGEPYDGTTRSLFVPNSEYYQHHPRQR